MILYLEQEHGLGAAAVEDMLYKQSGLLGVSEISSDMRALLVSEDPRARDAIDLFVFRIVREIGAMTASMGGCDGLVFTAGIGEHTPRVRAGVCARLDWLGFKLDSRLNAGGQGQIGSGASKPIWVTPTDEERMIATHTREVAFPP